MLVRRTLLATLLGLGLALGACVTAGDDHGSSSKAANDPTTPDPCAGELLFGPETFVRLTGPPQTESRTFNVPQGGEICLTISNVNTASASVNIDGNEIFGTGDFNHNVTGLNTTITVGPGTHTLDLTCASSPGSSLTVEIRGNAAPVDPPRLCSEVARDWCLDKGWLVAESSAARGQLICVADAHIGPGCNCDPCDEYNLVLWKDGSGDQFCSDVDYSTVAGEVRGGHDACGCTDNLLDCGTWEMENCIPD